jgi:RNA recognition motif-containing protein
MDRPEAQRESKFGSLSSFLRNNRPANSSYTNSTSGSDNQSVKNEPLSSSSVECCECPEKLVKRKIYIRNIEWSVHENMLAKFLAKFGEVKRCSILRDEFTTQSKGLGYAEFYTEQECERVLKAQPDELMLNGRQLNVSQYKEKTNKNKVSKRKCAQERIRRNTEARTSVSDQNPGDTDVYGVEGRGLIGEDQSAALSGNLAADLPYNILINIFSCLSIRDLCMAEQGE